MLNNLIASPRGHVKLQIRQITVAFSLHNPVCCTPETRFPFEFEAKPLWKSVLRKNEYLFVWSPCIFLPAYNIYYSMFGVICRLCCMKVKEVLLKSCWWLFKHLNIFGNHFYRFLCAECSTRRLENDNTPEPICQRMGNPLICPQVGN